MRSNVSRGMGTFLLIGGQMNLPAYERRRGLKTLMESRSREVHTNGFTRETLKPGSRRAFLIPIFFVNYLNELFK